MSTHHVASDDTPEPHGRSAATTPPGASSAALPPVANPVHELPPHPRLVRLLQQPDALPVAVHGNGNRNHGNGDRDHGNGNGDRDRAVVSDRAPPPPPPPHQDWGNTPLNAIGGDNRAPIGSEHPRAGTPRRPAAARCVASTMQGRVEAGAASRMFATSAWAGTRHSAATTPGPRGDDSHGSRSSDTCRRAHVDTVVVRRRMAYTRPHVRT